MGERRERERGRKGDGRKIERGEIEQERSGERECRRKESGAKGEKGNKGKEE